LDEDREIPPLNQQFFQTILVKVSVMLHQNEMLCKDEELVSAFEEQVSKTYGLPTWVY
jgi:hypothetical protein